MRKATENRPASDTTMAGGRVPSAPWPAGAFDELRQYLRVRRRGESHVPLAEQRRLLTTRWHSLIAEMAAA